MAIAQEAGTRPASWVDLALPGVSGNLIITGVKDEVIIGFIHLYAEIANQNQGLQRRRSIEIADNFCYKIRRNRVTVCDGCKNRSRIDRDGITCPAICGNVITIRTRPVQTIPSTGKLAS